MRSEKHAHAGFGGSRRPRPTAPSVAQIVALVMAMSLVGGGAAAWARKGRDSADIEEFTPNLLPAVRRAAAMVPGQLPTRIDVHVLSVFDISAASAAVGAPDVMVSEVRAAYQIRFPESWIMVDAGILYEIDDDATRAAYDRLQEGLLGARFVVFTHEHQDHVGGVVRSPHRAQLERNTLFTRRQLDWLVGQDPASLVRLMPEESKRFAVFDYSPLVPLAPGVVLIDAPGHTDGSQMVYVRLESGAEVVLAGDVSYLATALDSGWQKPDTPYLDEDRLALAAQMEWLREVSAEGVHVLLSHDYAMLLDLIADGVVRPAEDAPSTPPD